VTAIKYTCSSLVTIAEAVFFLDRGQTDIQTDKQPDATERYTCAGGYAAAVGNQTDSNTV